MNDKYFFPAIFEYDSESTINIFFPDLPGCFTFAESETEAFEMAREALSLHLYGMEEEGDIIPIPSKMNVIQRENSNQISVLIDIYMPVFRDKMQNKKIKKTLTIKSGLMI